MRVVSILAALAAHAVHTAHGSDAAPPNHFASGDPCTGLKKHVCKDHPLCVFTIPPRNPTLGRKDGNTYGRHSGPDDSSGSCAMVHVTDRLDLGASAKAHLRDGFEAFSHDTLDDMQCAEAFWLKDCKDLTQHQRDVLGTDKRCMWDCENGCRDSDGSGKQYVPCAPPPIAQWLSYCFGDGSGACTDTTNSAFENGYSLAINNAGVMFFGDYGANDFGVYVGRYGKLIRKSTLPSGSTTNNGNQIGSDTGMIIYTVQNLGKVFGAVASTDTWGPYGESYYEEYYDNKFGDEYGLDEGAFTLEEFLSDTSLLDWTINAGENYVMGCMAYSPTDNMLYRSADDTTVAPADIDTHCDTNQFASWSRDVTIIPTMPAGSAAVDPAEVIPKMLEDSFAKHGRIDST